LRNRGSLRSKIVGAPLRGAAQTLFIGTICGRSRWSGTRLREFPARASANALSAAGNG
jgi:hypothetical protein